ncbi:MAG: DUF1003 domain-containing protein [Candidatus Pelagadaptatus aseana]|uniref:DUF1003 domain-containing protein n=1 Tax=Candidatus Pelagadaptatus aseana TaxID=3120508 RepID=UPI0039B1FDA0
MKKYFQNLAKALIGKDIKELGATEKQVLESIAEHTTVSENVNEAYVDSLTFGERVADEVSRFGGSWKFIGIFFSIIAIWIITNSYFLLSDDAFDPYPYILLNLGLSTLAAFQAPIIMMSQNRQAEKDRLKQEAAYQINLKLEIEIMRLHDRLDDLTSRQTSD